MKTTLKVRRLRLALAVLLAASLFLASGWGYSVVEAAELPLDANMQKTWERTDNPVIIGAVTRSWLWGEKPLHVLQEIYNDGKRLVAYYDKARMEVTDPNGDRSSKYFVTNGLLVKEMISGLAQTGDKSTVNLNPSIVPIAGDVGFGNPGPNFSSFANFSTLQPNQNVAPNRVGQTVTATIDRQGKVGNNNDYAAYKITLSYYDTNLGHNIPGVFWDFMNSTGLVYENGKYTNGSVVDWIYSVGYPLSEAYWSVVQIENKFKPVLIQAFERRVLTYTPDNAPEWRVEMGNVGKQYYIWRYEYPYR